MSTSVTMMIAGLLALMSAGATQTPDPPCTLAITAPKSGGKVSDAEDVTGTAKGVPPGAHLWVFSHRKGIAKVWPQAGGSPHIDPDSTWSAYVTFGVPRDSGAPFEIIAAVVDDARHADLMKWVNKSDEAARYDIGVDQPTFLPACQVQRVVVTRK
jgi:hypothetical protein